MTLLPQRRVGGGVRQGLGAGPGSRMPGSPAATSKCLGLGLFFLTLPAAHHPCCPKSPDNSGGQVGGTERLCLQLLPLPGPFCAVCQGQRVKGQGWVWRKGEHRRSCSIHLNLHPGLKERIRILRERGVHRQAEESGGEVGNCFRQGQAMRSHVEREMHPGLKL